MDVIGPSTALATIAALAEPVASIINSFASSMVPTPMVKARFGTLLILPPNIPAFCLRVVDVRDLARVLDMIEDRGSLNPICPASPIPSN